MRRISKQFLRPGMKVARPIYSSNGNVLLNKGIVLTERYISRLSDIGIPSVYIDDELFPKDYEVNDVIKEETRVSAVKRVKSLFLSKDKKKPKGNIIASEEVIQSVNDILEELLSNRKIMLNLSDIRLSDEYVFGHSVNVCVLAIITGIGLGYDKTKLQKLAIGAMLHDIGKVKVPQEILNKPGKLTKEEFDVIKKHAEWGYELLRTNFNISATSCITAYQHHERYNGEGYPQGLKKEQIHEFAQITGLVDMYDAITANRVYRKAFPTYEAYEMLAGSGNYLFRFDLVQTFLNYVAAYPAGTIVELSTGQKAIVLETKAGMALYPKVKIIAPVGDTESFLDLTQSTNIVITKVFSEEELISEKRC